ncbi:MAG: hypothetical protein AAF587_22010 [Bacteroidota bacterium]
MSRINFTLSTKALSKLFRVRCLHAYYEDKVCKDFSITPSPECEIELRNDRLTFKQLAGGFIVFYHASQSVPILKSPAFRPTKLTFLIHNSNHEFLNFSDLPYPDPGSIFYFSNLHNNISGKEKLKLLHPKEFAQGDDATILQSAPKTFEYEFDKEIKFTEIQITDSLGEKVELPELPEGLANYAQKRHVINLTEYPEGRYTLTVKGKKGTSFDFYSGGPAFEDCQGVIEIFMTDEVVKAFQIADNKDVYPQEYHVQINSRATFWRYNLISNSDAEFSSHSIESRDNKVKFSKPEKTTLLNGTPATSLTSQERLPLRQFAEHKFELKVKKNNRWIRTPVRLPVPSPKMIQPDPKDQSKVYSEMYVYL